MKNVPRFVCIHGHFYQPPRENPWFRTVEVQDSAFPYHDWNERISAECYEPNSFARILDGQGRITHIVSNYERISFNYGPTLLSWMSTHLRRVYEAILLADKQSMLRFSGHGSALAQVYNHAILPLCNERDKKTQVLWGLRDFAARFGRLPEGMWLAETAVDTPSLEALAQHGIRFTVLSPYQAQAVRKRGESAYTDVRGGKVDTTMPYDVVLPSGRRIAVFFYDGETSRAVAFEKLLNQGEKLAERLLRGFSGNRHRPQLVHIATDGETYGHHHKYGEMALAFALRTLEQTDGVQLTNYGEFLALCPPTHEAQIVENTAWSCSHGLGRWTTDCGCQSGGNPGFHQRWRAPLRRAFDLLRDRLAPAYEQAMAGLLTDPWQARDAYIDALLDDRPDAKERFLQKQAKRPLTPDEIARVFQLLEMQRHLMLMYTSCAWFFDDISGVEPVQNLLYAARAMQLAQTALHVTIEPDFLDILAQAESNVPSVGTGRKLWETQVAPRQVDLKKAFAHYAIRSLFERHETPNHLYGYDIEPRREEHRHAGRLNLKLGCAHVRDSATFETATLCFAVLHFGDHNLVCGVTEPGRENFLDELQKSLFDPFERADLPTALRMLDHHFGSATFSLRDLFRDDSRRILDQLLRNTRLEVEASLRKLYDTHAPLLRFLTDLHAPLPLALKTAAEQALQTSVLDQLALPVPDFAKVRHLFEEAEHSGVAFEQTALSFALQNLLRRLSDKWRETPDSNKTVQALLDAVTLATTPPNQVDLWRTQNTFYELLQTVYRDQLQKTQKSSPDALRTLKWLRLFEQLGVKLSIRLPPSGVH